MVFRLLSSTLSRRITTTTTISKTSTDPRLLHVSRLMLSSSSFSSTRQLSTTRTTTTFPLLLEVLNPYQRLKQKLPVQYQHNRILPTRKISSSSSAFLTTAATPPPPPPPPSPPPQEVRIVEVGPRDGLQNESCSNLTTADKVQLIQMLYEAGCRHIEAGSFVSPKAVPAMADSLQVMQQFNEWRKNLQIEKQKRPLILSCLVPNVKGLVRAQSVQPDEIAIFASASEGFSQRNLQCSIAESLSNYQQVVDALRSSREKSDDAKGYTPRLRGYVSCVMACPYDGPSSPVAVARVCEQLLLMGCDEISLGDTIGVGTVGTTKRLLQEVRPLFHHYPDHNQNQQQSSASQQQQQPLCAVHFHDTYGQALANILTSLESGFVSVVDASVAGLGGCPYAKGATGNVATEDVVYMLNGMGIQTNIDLNKLVDAAAFITQKLRGNNATTTTTQSRTANALLAKRQQQQQQ